MIKNVTADYFNKNVYDLQKLEQFNSETGTLKFLGKKPLVIDFHAKWCGPCKMLSPIIDELDEYYDGKIDFYKIDIEDENGYIKTEKLSELLNLYETFH